MSADFNETRVPTTDWQAYRGVLSRRIFAFLIDYAIIALLWIRPRSSCSSSVS